MSFPSASLVRASRIGLEYAVKAGWSFEELAGRFSELSGWEESACLTLASSLVADTQRLHLPVAWISATACPFFPPDMAANGVDLEALPIVWAPNAHSAGLACEMLARSGAFGLIVLDLGSDIEIPMALQGRLVKLAQKHRTALLCLTKKREQMPSLSSIVSLRVMASRQKMADSRFRCVLRAVKDKRRAPGWQYSEVFHGPPGLR
jgi:recombination protein RecA